MEVIDTENSVTNEMLSEQLERIEALLALTHIDERSRVIWNVEEVADYLRIEPRTVREYAVKDRTFPKPILLPQQRNVAKETHKKRWFAGEIVAYAERRKKR